VELTSHIIPVTIPLVQLQLTPCGGTADLVEIFSLKHALEEHGTAAGRHMAGPQRYVMRARGLENDPRNPPEQADFFAFSWCFRGICRLERARMGQTGRTCVCHTHTHTHIQTLTLSHTQPHQVISWVELMTAVCRTWPTTQTPVCRTWPTTHLGRFEQQSPSCTSI
jgi:hypothetical protein